MMQTRLLPMKQLEWFQTIFSGSLQSLKADNKVVEFSSKWTRKYLIC